VLFNDLLHATNVLLVITITKSRLENSVFVRVNHAACSLIDIDRVMDVDISLNKSDDMPIAKLENLNLQECKTSSTTLG
jgi:hypothetical protein